MTENPEQVFEFFDHFVGALDTSKWDDGNEDASTSASHLVLTPVPTTDTAYVKSTSSYSEDVAIRFRIGYSGTWLEQGCGLANGSDLIMGGKYPGELTGEDEECDEFLNIMKTGQDRKVIESSIEFPVEEKDERNIIEIRWSSNSKVWLFVDDVQAAYYDTSQYIPTASISPYIFATDEDGSLKVDWYLVRIWEENGPSVSSWDDEEPEVKSNKIVLETLLKGDRNKVITLDTNIGLYNTKTISLDTILYKPFEIPIDTILKGKETLSYSLDTVLETEITDRTVLFEYGSQTALHIFRPAPSELKINKGKMVAKIDILKSNEDYFNILGDTLETINLKGVILNQRLYNLGDKTDKEQIDSLLDIIHNQKPVMFHDKNYGQVKVLLKKLVYKRIKGEDGYTYDIELNKVNE